MHLGADIPACNASGTATGDRQHKQAMKGGALHVIVIDDASMTSVGLLWPLEKEVSDLMQPTRLEAARRVAHSET